MSAGAGAGEYRITGLAGEGEEDLVERRPAQTDVVDDDATPPNGIPAAGPPLRARSRRHDHFDPDLHRPSGRWGQPEAPAPEPAPEPESTAEPPSKRMPRKLTVTRVAALRSREITENSWRAFHRAATADGRSGSPSSSSVSASDGVRLARSNGSRPASSS